jgi:dephospho-CoA kinase
MVVGLTGGIATGKSTVARLFVGCGARLVDADVLAREAIAPGRSAYDAIIAVFGRGIRGADGTIDRDRLGKLVFGEPTQLARLNAIVHPHVVHEQERLCREIAKKEPAAIVIYDAALLIETGAHKRTDRVVVVTADEHTQLERLMSRNGLSENEANQRIHAQMPLTEKVKLANYVIDGTLPLDQLNLEVKRIYEELRKMA